MQEEKQYPTKNPITSEVINYDKRKQDGIMAVAQLMSELKLNSEANGYPRAINKSIEEAFKDVTYNLVSLGWWISAKECCELVVVEGYVTQTLYDRIYSTICNYIIANY